jgi:hypothetical protein
MRTITRPEYLQLIGLLALAQRHNAMLNEIAEAIRAITDERDRDGAPNYSGHSFDAVWSDYSADDLLRKLDISVEAKEKT